MRNRQNFIEKLKQTKPSIDEIETEIQMLKNEGLSEIDCVVVLVQGLSLPLKKANELVLYSNAFKANLDSNVSLQNAFMDSWEAMDDKIEENKMEKEDKQSKKNINK